MLFEIGMRLEAIPSATTANRHEKPDVSARIVSPPRCEALPVQETTARPGKGLATLRIVVE